MSTSESSQRPTFVDFHTHLIAEDPARGNYLSAKKKNSVIGRFLKYRLGFRGEGFVEDFCVGKIVEYLHDPQSPVTHAVLLGLDAVHDRDGTQRLDKTDIAISNDYLLGLGAQHPEIIPAVSIHPYRKDALEELDRLASMGAKIIKWLPNSQDFDPADEKLRPFYRRVAALGIPILCHTGYEHAIKPWRQDVGDPARLAMGLNLGVTFIAAHAGSSGIAHRHEHFGTFLRMLDEHPNLYGDLSALTNISRFPYLKKLVDEGRYWNRLIHGSDFPVPPSPLLFADRIGLSQAIRLAKIPNPLHRDAAIKKAVGVPDSVAENGLAWLGLTKGP